MLKRLSYLPTNPLFLVVHATNVCIALTTSIIQTRRIMKNSRKAVSIAIIPLVLGGIIALFGTIAILKKINTGTKFIKDTNQIVHKIKERF